MRGLPLKKNSGVNWMQSSPSASSVTPVYKSEASNIDSPMVMPATP